MAIVFNMIYLSIYLFKMYLCDYIIYSFTYLHQLFIYLLITFLFFIFFNFKICWFIYMYLLFVHSLARLIILFNFYYWKLCHLLHSFTRIWANKYRSVCTYKIRSSAKSDLTFQYPSKPTTDNTYYDLPGKYTISTISATCNRSSIRSAWST